MTKKIIGISGSPVNNSNTDRAVKRLMDETGYQTEFVKLSKMDIRPCFACKGCVADNVCKVHDDFPALAQKLLEADAVVLGGYIPFGQLDGFTRAFIERLWSLKHDNTLLKDKPWATILNGLDPDALEEASKALAKKLTESDRVNLLGQILLTGNVPCNTCGKGEQCKTSAIHKMRKIKNNNTLKISDLPYVDCIENDGVCKEITKLASKIVSVA
ncbi:flavodoxin family protein [Desulforhopalus sp. IMCC35007]|jgi:multimeric flavodoxin WrbA|uniref:flavodoxin family protein n=1 Tax=Desulforhopalus sp. IMCC35007 TaxID=2569543 RepID=UPI0010AE7AD4|nr:flavodoxin family protein [Desulforhopalus sp. IMCC35007]TKB06819.1 flavodoxin family protein [Desulforhopalus sp. IMCC35007]